MTVTVFEFFLPSRW